MAQTKGRFEAYDLGSCKLHVYYTNDVMGDASYIIEDEDSLVTMEHPLFKETWRSSTTTSRSWASPSRKSSPTIM